MFDPDQLLDALRGVQRAYYLPIVDPYMVQSAVAFAVAAREARLEAIVQLSQWLSHRAHPAQLTRTTWLVDQLFAAIPGIAHTIINPGMFADNFLRTIDFPALLGIYPVLMGQSRCAPVSNEDIGRVVAAVLAAPERHAGMRYRPTGPALMTGREMAAVVSRVVGHRVLPVDLPFWMFSKVARMQRVDPFLISSLRDYIVDNKAGAFSFEGGVSSVVEELTGTPAESFETTARRYAAMPFAAVTPGNRMKADRTLHGDTVLAGLRHRQAQPAMALPGAAESQPLDRRCALAHRAQPAKRTAVSPGRRYARFNPTRSCRAGLRLRR